MPVKGLQLLPFIALAMLAGASSSAQEQPRSMLGDFDLKRAVLSPTPLGPPSHFEPPPAAAKRAPEKPVARKPTAEPTVTESKPAPAPRKKVSRTPRQKPTVAARKPQRNPLDSYARDPRPQIWPCVNGGICTWRQPPLSY